MSSLDNLAMAMNKLRFIFQGQAVISSRIYVLLIGRISGLCSRTPAEASKESFF